MGNIPEFNISNLIEAGVHFGHSTSRWNPKMGPYIYGIQNGTHIINLEKTVYCLRVALEFVYAKAKDRGRILFVGTKSQASGLVKEAALKCGQYYVNHRWLGGMLTNFKTVSGSINNLIGYEKFLSSAESEGYTKKEIYLTGKKRDKLELALGGIRNMGGLPDVVFILDGNKEHVAIAEAKKLKIPIVSIVDTNVDPSGIDYVIPGNDDAVKALEFYCNVFSETILSGISYDLKASGIDVDSVEGTASNSKKTEKIRDTEKSSSKDSSGE